MKKAFLLAAAFAVTSFAVSAQEYLQFFPNEEGATMVSKSYDGNNNLISTTTVTVEEAYEYGDGSDIKLRFVMNDAMGNMINDGKIDASYVDGNFYMDMTNLSVSPCIAQYISPLTELSGDFLDYPDPFLDNSFPYEPSDFPMSGGQFSIRTKGDKEDVARVEVYNRKLGDNETVSTPAGNFDAAKITFNVDVIKDGKTTTYKGVEWYSYKAGIVKTEIYDSNDNLHDYTVLASMTK